MSRRACKGVTLIELAIGVVVLGIVIAIAVPSYRLHVVRTQRADAREALLGVQAAQEKYLVQQGRYAGELAALGLQRTSERGLYALKMALSKTGYVASASVVSSSSRANDTRCAVFTLTETGTRTARDQSGADRSAECWR